MGCWNRRRASWVAVAPIFPILVVAKMARNRRSSWECGESWDGREDCRTDTHRASRAGARAEEAVKETRKNIAEAAVAAGAFSTLVEALKVADLVDTLAGDGPFTVFAPTDDAFARLPEGALNELLADKEKLTEVLTYHVVAGRLGAADLAGVERAKTLQGQSLGVETSLGVKIGDAYVVEADVPCSNGVIHAIDSVLLPAG